MTISNFHEAFSEETLLKLKLFRAYVHEWLPVFLSRGDFPQVNIFDFFAGPGRDAKGNPGSPLIVLEEAREFWARKSVSPRVNLNLHFNDRDKQKTNQLKVAVEQYEGIHQWQIKVTTMDFAQAYEESMPLIRNRESASLLIIDQFGYKHMPPERFAALAECKTTDVLCFMTSSNIRRFVKEEAVQRYIGIPPEEIASLPPSDAHRCVCRFYRGCVPQSAEYYVAPFSIKRNANYNGLMFGSRNLLGLEKFLKTCWDFDESTGEANFPIDNDPIVASHGQLSFFEEDNVPKKKREFLANLVGFISAKPRSNQEVYRFALENGFLGKHAKGLLKALELTGALMVERLSPSAKRGGYYITREEYMKAEPKAMFSYKGKHQ